MLFILQWLLCSLISSSACNRRLINSSIPDWPVGFYVLSFFVPNTLSDISGVSKCVILLSDCIKSLMKHETAAGWSETTLQFKDVLLKMGRVSVHFERWKTNSLDFWTFQFKVLSEKNSRKWIKLLWFQNSRRVGVFFVFFAKFQCANEAEQARRHNVQKSYTKAARKVSNLRVGDKAVCVSSSGGADR